MADVSFEFGTAVADKALNSIVEFCKKTYGKTSVELGTDFHRYLENAYLRYNQKKTLATGITPRNIIGKDSIYVNVGITYYGSKINTVTVEPMIEISRNILITATGGAGKSMLMRYLFLNTRNNGNYVPVFLRLNKISEQPVDNISVFDLIYSAMEEFDVKLPKEMFEYSLRQGKYLFLLDGFDEIKESHSKKAAEIIQSFCSKYPKNPCIVTSRPNSNTYPLETFTTLRMLDFNKEQAAQLIRKIGEKDEKTEAFLKVLDEKLFDEPYSSFTKNPLLLSMMFITFRRNNSVPDRMVQFYSKAYDALYNLHDSSDKGAYKREYLSSLDENQFKNVFAHFCFRSYMAQKYSFNEDEIIGNIEKSLVKCGAKKTEASNYLKDLETAVCLLVKDGTDYVFSHRSFQTYFASIYTANLDDKKQKIMFRKLLSEEDYNEKHDFYDILLQLEPERFIENALEDGLREFVSFDCIKCLKNLYNGFSISKDEYNREYISLFSYSTDIKYYYNIYHIFFNYCVLYYSIVDFRFLKGFHFLNSKQGSRFFELYDKVAKRKWRYEQDTAVKFIELDNSKLLTDDEKKELYSLGNEGSGFKKQFNFIRNWLNDLDEKRTKLKNASSDDDFFENL